MQAAVSKTLPLGPDGEGDKEQNHQKPVGHLQEPASEGARSWPVGKPAQRVFHAMLEAKPAEPAHVVPTIE
jgi:hypothetical protein